MDHISVIERRTRRASAQVMAAVFAVVLAVNLARETNWSPVNILAAGALIGWTVWLFRYTRRAMADPDPLPEPPERTVTPRGSARVPHAIPATHLVDARVRALVFEGRKLDAVNLVQAEHGLALQAALHRVDGLAERDPVYRAY